MSARPRPMKCACCGGYAGKFHQHWNQDTGYGICRSCVDWIASRGESPESIRFTYGKAGHNYEAKQHRLGGRLFNVLAEFFETDADAANAYMTKYHGASVLAVEDGRVILADVADEGVPVVEDSV